MLQRRGDVNLSGEAIGAECFGKLRAKDLGRDESLVSKIFREIDGRRAALAELALDEVTATQGAAEVFEERVRQSSLPAIR
jgi:hypothetical protein